MWYEIQVKYPKEDWESYLGGNRYDTMEEAMWNMINYIATGGNPDAPESWEADIKGKWKYQDSFEMEIKWHSGGTWKYRTVAVYGR